MGNLIAYADLMGPANNRARAKIGHFGLITDTPEHLDTLLRMAGNRILCLGNSLDDFQYRFSQDRDQDMAHIADVSKDWWNCKLNHLKFEIGGSMSDDRASQDVRLVQGAVVDKSGGKIPVAALKLEDYLEPGTDRFEKAVSLAKKAWKEAVTDSAEQKHNSLRVESNHGDTGFFQVTSKHWRGDHGLEEIQFQLPA